MKSSRILNSIRSTLIWIRKNRRTNIRKKALWPPNKGSVGMRVGSWLVDMSEWNDYRKHATQRIV